MAIYVNKFFLGEMRACGTIILIKGEHNIVVDTGGPKDKSDLITGSLYK